MAALPHLYDCGTTMPCTVGMECRLGFGACIGAGEAPMRAWARRGASERLRCRVCLIFTKAELTA
eukprot:2349080-Rhodomonas_salina.2